MSAQKKRLAFALVLALLVWIAIEAFAFATHSLTDDLYDHRARVLERIAPADLAQTRERIDPVLGWVPRAPSVTVEPNCLGADIEYRIDDLGVRVYPGYRASEARVVVVGDSYTRGDEVRAAHSYPAQLAALLGASVANLGVGGYGPTQALLRLERDLDHFPAARAIVLGVMYENVYRMVNSYRGALYDKADPYSFKPYMKAEQVEPHPGAAAFVDVEALLQLANAAFDEDFWAKPRHRFPYTLALGRALTTHFFVYRKLQKRLRNLGRPEYIWTYRSEAFTTPLLALLDRLAQLANERDLSAVAVFFPRNRHDTQSAAEFLASPQARARLAPLASLVVGDLGSAPVDWARFNLEEPGDDNICHPSPYGYQAMAGYVADLLKTSGGWP